MSNTDSGSIPSKRLQESNSDTLGKKKTKYEDENSDSSEESENIKKGELGEGDDYTEGDTEFNLAEYLRGADDEDESENSQDSEEDDDFDEESESLASDSG